MNILFLINAGLLALLSGFLLSRRIDRLTFFFTLTSLGLASWNICIFLTEERFFVSSINTISKLQLLSAMVFTNGLYYFCTSYPVPRGGKSHRLSLAVAAGMAAAVLFTNLITEARVVDGQIVYLDQGYVVYALYLMVLGIGALIALLRTYRRMPEYRPRIKYFLIGISIYVVNAIIFNLMLPQFGIYDYLIVGRLSATFPPLFMFYAITKHEFLDISIIINKYVAWVAVVAAMGLSFLLVMQYSPEGAVEVVALMVLGMFWGVYARPLQQFLLTSAKRKFIRGWYTPEEVISQLSTEITQEKNREAIFRTIEKVLDNVFELENSLVMSAVRDEQGNFSHYKVLHDGRKLPLDHPLINPFLTMEAPRLVEQLDPEVIEALEALGFKQNRRCLVLPFHSPEYLEGLIVLGERSNQQYYSEADLKFFHYLVSYVSPILYRLTPMEKLERLYFENKQKLHDAEIQLIRAQKIESIVHATRQCHHEIRTPLNIIRLGIGRIKSLEDLEAYKQVASEEISRALEIVEETLTITDVTKASPDRYSRLDVNEVLGRCAKLVDPRRYHLELELGDTGLVWGSLSDIQIVITNLIHNAMDAMGEEGNLALRSLRVGDSVVIEVEDSGRGIPEHLRSRVWEPYFSGHETEVGNSTAGRGWGLTIVNRIITEHMGTINFTSEVGVGTKFTVVLPALVENGEQENNKVIPFNSRRIS